MSVTTPTSPKLPFSIRKATSEDSERIYKFIMDLAIYEKAPEEVQNTPEKISELVFGPSSTVKAILCEIEESSEAEGRVKRPVGFAIYFYNYSTWTGRHGLYLEDLYVDPTYRGTGAGKSILKYLAREAVANECARMEWVCLNWNEPAINFYKSLGAFGMSDWTTFRLTGDALLRFGDAEVVAADSA